MRHVRRGISNRGLLSWILAPLLVVSLAGCTENGNGVVIVQAQVPDENCVIPAMRTTVRRASGVLDVALDQNYPYLLYPLVLNRLSPIADPMDVEPNRVNVVGAEIRIEPPPGVSVPWRADCPPAFDHASTVSLDPNTEGSIAVEALRSCHAGLFRELFRSGRLSSSLAEQIQFRVIVRAKARHGSGTILSDPFEFAVRVCYGCLQSGFLGPFSAFNFPEVPACDRLSENPFPGNRCNPGQDAPILCCAKDPEGKMLECPGTPRAPAGAPMP